MGTPRQFPRVGAKSVPGKGQRDREKLDRCIPTRQAC